MEKNNTLKEVAKILSDENNNSILLFPHINMDGDALGSAVALCSGLRQAGKEAYILIEDEIPDFISFLDDGYCTKNFGIIENPDVCICIDCGDEGRFPKRKEKFYEGKITGCIDHHVTSEPFTDFYYIDSKAAATGELVYDVIKEMGITINEEIAAGLFVAITTDTGNFQYSNTRKKTHLIAAELYDLNVEYDQISAKLYQNNRLEKLKLEVLALNEMKIFAGKKAAICGATQEMLKKTNCKMEETEGFIDILRNISGVEIAVFVKENEENKCKVSMRSKSYANVAEISCNFNGGGHKRAAGFTLNKGYEEAWDIVTAAVEEYLKKSN